MAKMKILMIRDPLQLIMPQSQDIIELNLLTTSNLLIPVIFTFRFWLKLFLKCNDQYGMHCRGVSCLHQLGGSPNIPSFATFMHVNTYQAKLFYTQQILSTRIFKLPMVATFMHVILAIQNYSIFSRFLAQRILSNQTWQHLCM